MHIIMFDLRFNFLIFIGSILTPVIIQSIPDGWQSSTSITSNGFEFSPVNLQALLLSNSTANSLFSCTRLCHSNGRCRIFDFDGQSNRCRLFEGNITTMGSIVASSSSQSRVGSIQISPNQFVNHGQSCSFCQGSRYMTCINGTCECQTNTYFDGSICESQKLLGGVCVNTTECRSDLNYTCLSNMQCGVPSIQIARIVAGNANGMGGSSLTAFQTPTGLAVGVDNSLYVADLGNNRVIKLQVGYLNGSMVAGIGGGGGAGLNQLNGPTGIHVDASFNLYIADAFNYRVMLWRKNALVGVQVAGTGSPGSSTSSFNVLAGIYVDSQGNLYVSDSNNHRVMQFPPNATNAIIVAGTGSPGSGSYQLNSPYGIYFDDINSYLYVADYNNHRIQRFQVGVSTNGTTVAGGHGLGSASNQLSYPYSVCVSKITNAIYTTDSGNSRVQCWSSGATSGVTIAGNGASISNFSTPLSGITDIRLSINDTYLFVNQATYNRVWGFPLV